MMPPTLIDHALPRFDIEQPCSTHVPAGPEQTFAALAGFDPHTDKGLAAAFWLHDAPARLWTANASRARSLSLPGTLQSRAMAVRAPDDRTPGELLLGFVGKFWWLPGPIATPPLEQFRDTRPRGVTRVVWGFAVHPAARGASLLTCTLRARSSNRAERLAFGAYWRIVARASGAVRARLLDKIKTAAQAHPSTRP